MTEYLEKLEYGHMKVDSSNIDRFWLEGASRIDQMQQIHFLKKFYQAQLPISERTKEIMKRLMLIEENDTYKIYGKTGWSVSEGHDNGWFVGYIETQKKVYFFATNIEPKEHFDMAMFLSMRKEVTYRAFEKMGILK